MVSGCSHVQWQPAGAPIGAPALNEDHVLTADGYRLPLPRWLPPGEIKAVVLGLHGFNDYGNAFRYLQEAVVEAGNVAIYAYDQRGFGATKRPGIWAGRDTLVDDARTVAALLRTRYSHQPLFLIGESMGAAVVLSALAEDDLMPVDGAVLIAPAVWGPDAMPWYQRLGLWLAVRLMPGEYFSSETVRRMGKRPTDDSEVMRELSSDPLVLKGARVDTLHGVSELMQAASRVVSVPVPLQTLYGLNDQIVPSEPVCSWLRRLTQSTAAEMRIVLYPDGYHLLTRYSNRAKVIADIAAWLSSPKALLPSGNEIGLDEARAMGCAD
nr:alpha/beta hydrolase fold carboxyl esterase [uncultured bacterium]